MVDADDEESKGSTEMALSLLVMASTDNEVGEERDEEVVDARARPLTSCLRDIGCHAP